MGTTLQGGPVIGARAEVLSVRDDKPICTLAIRVENGR
jgi:hypothetical protein